MIVHVTYGQYSGRYNEAQIGENSPVGNPALIDSFYTGPGRTGPQLRRRHSNPANYPILVGQASVPIRRRTSFDRGMTSPLTHEFTLSFGENLFGNRGYGEVTYVAPHHATDSSKTS